MSFLWDSNILRHYLDTHPRLLENLKKVPRQSILLPVVVVAEQLRGRSEAVLKAEPTQIVRTQELFRQTQTLLSKFEILYFDQQALAVAERFKEQLKTRKRHADILIAAQTLAGRHVLVTRNTADFRDLLPPAQLQNWIDNEIR